MELHELLSVGMVILLGILGGKLAHRLKVPRVTGYMLTGLLFGPSVLGLISDSTLHDIHLLNEIALGLILFAIGGEIEISHLRSMGRRIILIGLAESAGAFVLVFAAAALITRDLPLSAVLGAISIATAPGVILLVLREYRASGPLSETLLATVAINNVLCLVGFRLVFSAYSLLQGDPLGATLWVLTKELILSVAIGASIAVVITFWEQYIDDLSELLLIIIGGLLGGIGLAKTLGISQLLVCLIIGAVTNNLSMMHRLVYAELRQTEMPFYIAFFVLSGASLHLGSVAGLGVLGLAYLVMRPLGKIIGARLAAGHVGAARAVRDYLGLSLFPQAGVAIGMAITVSERYPEIGHIVSTVILSSVIVYEGLGPFLTKTALAKAGELHPED
jgi:Kef-type K+ transport system membrane component KefB